MLLLAARNPWAEKNARMRASEFVVENSDISTTTYNLISTLADLRSKTDKIRVDSLVNLVRRRPGSEMFNVDLLIGAQKKDSTVQNMIKDINSDNSGVKYVYLKNLNAVDQTQTQDQDEQESNSISNSTGSQDTVQSMAKRAAKKRT